ncbi:MAG: RNA polymerase sigma factor [Deltaproteobacteria bacterium]|nr:RNA polymerase sigma factor [Deltaproteobacteria bacterium]MCB9789048.1 RNA polymerase sigma factor [Deltaproteobacteria bacterium]
MEQELSDEQLMKRYLAGHPSAFQELMARHGQKIFNYVLRQMRDPSVAEDLTQEVFLRVVHRAQTFREEARFTTWLFSIARNLCVDTARKAKHRRTVALDAPLDRSGDGGATMLDRVADGGPGPDRRTRDKRFRECLDSAMARLPDEQREVFLMREVEGLKFREIAEVVGIPENTVKSRMRYALESLRVSLAAFREEP